MYATTLYGTYAAYFNGSLLTSGSYVTSDAKLKQNVTDVNNAMAIINQLHPKTYNYRQDGDYKQMNLEHGMHYGLIAQDVEKVLPNLVKDSKFDMMDSKTIKRPEPTSTVKNPKPEISAAIIEKSGKQIDFKAVNYTELIPVLIKGMQEMNAEKDASIDSLKSEIGHLKSEIENIKAMVATNQSTVNGKQSIVLSTASLQQNIPNPFTNTTSIGYSLNQKFSSAQIIITDKNGKTLKAINIFNGKGNVKVDASTLAVGAYQYSLMIDGKLIATKQMIIAK